MLLTNAIKYALEKDGVAVLPPMDVFNSISIVQETNIPINCTILDPWYNKGFGGELPTEQYDKFISMLLNKSAEICDLIYLWGFPEVIGPCMIEKRLGVKRLDVELKNVI